MWSEQGVSHGLLDVRIVFARGCLFVHNRFSKNFLEQPNSGPGKHVCPLIVVGAWYKYILYTNVFITHVCSRLQ